MYLQVVYSGVPEKAYKVFLKAQTRRNRKPDDFNTKNPAGTATKLFLTDYHDLCFKMPLWTC